jgi:hypothetical protein
MDMRCQHVDDDIQGLIDCGEDRTLRCSWGCSATRSGRHRASFVEVPGSLRERLRERTGSPAAGEPTPPPTDIIGMPFLLSSPGALGVARNLPAGFAGGALHPPVVPARVVLDPQEEREHAGSVSEANSHPRVAAGRRIERVEPNTTVDGLLDECELRVRILVLAGNRVVRISGAS